jgi:hypothetical protein
MRIRTLGVLSCLAGALTCAAQQGAATGTAVPLAVGGKAICAIGVAADATAAERNAAAELAAYLKKVTGAEFAILEPAAAAGRPVIAVGPGAAKAVVPDLDLAKAGPTGLGEDGIVLKTVPPNLILTGAEGAKRGTLYAAYEFLERECGVRWWTPEAELVPSRPTLTVAACATRYVPPFAYREVGRTTPAPFRFDVRLRQNGAFAVKTPPEWGGHCVFIGYMGECFYGLMPPATYFKDHPEWYSEINGKRTTEKSQLCMTNEAMLAELSRNVLERIRKRPDADMVCIWPNDICGMCTCPKCKAVDDAEGTHAASLLYGVNKVAEIVEKEFPNVRVTTLAYQAPYSMIPPKTIRPRRNVNIQYAVIERSAVHTIEGGVNQMNLLALEGWSRLAPDLYIWDYTANLANPFVPEPRTFAYGPDMKLYKRLGVTGVLCQHSLDSVSPLSDFDELHTWLLAKLLWNPEQDDRALVREFLNGYYGPAGTALEACLEVLARKVGEHKVASWAGPRDAEWLDPATLDRATELMDAAAKAAAGDEVLAARVQRARLSLDHQWLCGYAGYRFVADAEKTSFRGPADFSKAIAEFVGHCRSLGVESIGYGQGQTLEAYVQSLRLAGQTVPARFALATNPTYKSFLAGERMPLPAPLTDLPAATVVDVQEDRMSIFPGALAVADPKAVNAAAAQIDPAVVSWAVQVRDLADQGVKGRWHAYAVIRVEAVADATGLAFTGGVYDSESGRNLFGISQRLEGQAGGPPDPNVGTDRTTALADRITDGEYRLYDFGAHDVHDGIYLWLGTTGGVDPKTVKAIYVDRFIFVRETAKP